MPEEHLYAVIPAGGAGTRLWPRSRRSRPKHTLDLTGAGRALIVETYERARGVAAEVLVLTEEAQVPAIRELLPQLRDDQLIVEPTARGTTSALGLASLTLLQRDPEAVMISLPADHIVRGTAAFRAAVRRAAGLARRTGRLVAIGLEPTHPATGLGYIRTGSRRSGGALAVEEFVEKPDEERALRYLRHGGYYWNLAMFSWRAAAFVEQLARHSPGHHAGLSRVLAARGRGDEAAARRAYARLPTTAVDYGVMEKTDRLLLVPARFKWLDVGSWAELHSLVGKDTSGNYVEGETVLVDTEGTYVSAPGVLVAAIGLRDMVVVGSQDAILIAPKSRAQDVKRVVELLAASRRLKYL